MEHGHLILLNGASSSGKTATGRAMQDLCSDLHVLLGIDAFCQAIPPGQLFLESADPAYYRAETIWHEGQPWSRIIPGPRLDAVMAASYRAIASYLEDGVNVISDQLFWSPSWFRAALDAWAPYRVFCVAIHVSESEGVRRERERSRGDVQDQSAGGRPDGFNRATEIITHRGMVYDFEIDNSRLDPGETGRRILAAYRSCPEPWAFRALLASFPS